jgi:hypothetical protein
MQESVKKLFLLFPEANFLSQLCEANQKHSKQFPFGTDTNNFKCPLMLGAFFNIE